MSLSIQELPLEQDLAFFIDMEYEANLDLQSKKAAMSKDGALEKHRKPIIMPKQIS